MTPRLAGRSLAGWLPPATRSIVPGFPPRKGSGSLSKLAHQIGVCYPDAVFPRRRDPVGVVVDGKWAGKPMPLRPTPEDQP